MAKVLVEKTVEVDGHEVVFRVVTNKAGVNALYAKWLDEAAENASLADLGRLSVAKWVTMVMGYNAGATCIADGGGTTCAFCQRFYDREKGVLWCVGCPIAAYSGEPECWGTPYHDYWREMASPGSTPETLTAEAQEELLFVKTVVAWVKESGYKEPNDEIPF